MDKPRAGWADIKAQLAFMEKADLLRLVKDLHDASPSNKAFLAARFLAPEDAGPILEEYRQRVIAPFFPKRGFGKLNLADARKAIREYRKARSDMAGTLELMLTYVEIGTRFTNEYGDITDAFYNSLLSVLNELVTLFQSPPGRELYPQFQRRLRALAAAARDIGWGYGDEVAEQIGLLEDPAEDE